MSGFAEYPQYDGLGLAELVRKREVHPRELVEEAIRRVEALNPHLNAVVHKMYDYARAAAESELPGGALRGVPFLLKDQLASFAGQPMRSGTRSMRDYVPDHDSELVARFKRAGVITVGKTNLPEFGLSPTTESELYGPARNPWNTGCTPSGSSGGSAAAVASRMVPIASGGDGGGSIRTPAAACGVFGLKPSRGRNPTGPDYGELWHGAVCEHVLTRTVRDSAAMLDATSGPDVGAPYVAPPPPRPFLQEVGADPGKLRIAYSAQPLLGDHVDADCVEGLEATVALLRELGHETVEAAIPLDRHEFMHAFLTLVCGETAADIDDTAARTGRKARTRDFELSTWVMRLLGETISAAEFNLAVRYLQRETRKIAAFCQDYDAVLTPTLAAPPVATGTLQPSAIEKLVLRSAAMLRAGGALKRLKFLDLAGTKVFAFSAYTPVFNVTGQPAMSVPLHWSAAGLPVGMQFAARYGDEPTLFRLAAQLEQARPWIHRAPPVCRHAS